MLAMLVRKVPCEIKVKSDLSRGNEGTKDGSMVDMGEHRGCSQEFGAIFLVREAHRGL